MSEDKERKNYFDAVSVRRQSLDAVKSMSVSVDDWIENSKKILEYVYSTEQISSSFQKHVDGNSNP